MNLTKPGVVLALAALLLPTIAFAGQPEPAAAGATAVRDKGLTWTDDGTRELLRDELKRLLGNEKNTFGSLVGGENEAEGVAPEGSELLGDFLGHVIGIPGPELVLPNGDHFYSGAEPHDATREAAVITRGRGKDILAMAVFEASSTGRVNRLTILVPRGHHLAPAMQAQFTSWARHELEGHQATLRGSTLAHMVDTLAVETRTLGQP